MSITPAGSFATIHCYFCGGAECKYENWKLWLDKGTNAFDGLYSNWITNTILAMQRPSTRLMKKYDLINKFKEAGIGAIFNLQQPREHTGCGDGLDPNSDFSYVPEDWMEAGISYLQYGWVDMDTPNCDLILGAVQLMSYMIASGKKVAVHCHAGLGRTGLLIASYLIFDKNMTPLEAQQLVRLARPGSIQNKKQTAFLGIFENYLTKLRFYYPQMVMSGMMSTPAQTFLDILQNQSICLHGKEERRLRWVPKPIYLLSKHLKSLYQIPENRLRIIDEIEHLDNHFNTEEFIKLQSKINSGEWAIINSLDIKLTVHLLLIFFLSLKDSLIDNEFISHLESSNKVEKNVLLHQRLDLGILTTICVILDIFKMDDNLKKMDDNIELVFVQLAGIFSPERPSWIPTDTLQLSTPGVHSLNLNLKLPQMPKFFQDWTGIGKKFRRKMSVPVWNIYETLQYIYNSYNIEEDEISIVPVDDYGRINSRRLSPSQDRRLSSSQDSVVSSVSFTICDSNIALDFCNSNAIQEPNSGNKIKIELYQCLTDIKEAPNMANHEVDQKQAQGMIDHQDQSVDLVDNIDLPQEECQIIQDIPDISTPQGGDTKNETDDGLSAKEAANMADPEGAQKQIEDSIDNSSLPGYRDQIPPVLELTQVNHSDTKSKLAQRLEYKSPESTLLAEKGLDLSIPDQNVHVPDENLQEDFCTLGLNSGSETSNQNKQEYENESIVP